MTTGILGLLWLLLLVEGSKAFTYHETINVAKKSPNKHYDHILGPEFDEDGRFTYLKVKSLNRSPPTLEVCLETYSRDLPMATKNTKKIMADIVSPSIRVTSMKLGKFLSINEQQLDGSRKDMLFKWSTSDYAEPSYQVPKNHIIIGGNEQDFDIIIDDNDTCHTFNGKCRIRLQGNEKPTKTEFYHGDLEWSTIQVSRGKSSYSQYFVRGFTAAGEYNLLVCNVDDRESGGCTRLLSLRPRNRMVQFHSLNDGACYIEQPGIDNFVNCYKFHMTKKGTDFDRTASYGNPMTLLDATDITLIDESHVFVIANRYKCVGNDCFNVVLTDVPEDSSKLIHHRHLTLDCSDNDKLFKVSLKQQPLSKSVVIEYICESDVEFTFKTAIFNDVRLIE